MVVLGYLCTFCGLFVCLFVCLFVFMPLVRYFSSAKEATDLNFFFFFALFSLNIQRWTIIIGLRDCT